MIVKDEEEKKNYTHFYDVILCYKRSHLCYIKSTLLNILLWYTKNFFLRIFIEKYYF